MTTRKNKFTRGKHTLLLCAILFFLITSVYPYPPINADISGTVSGTTRYVGGTGPGNYSTIQGAITVAASGDTIVVYPGLYQENLLISKSLTLRGKNQATTIIKPLQLDHVVTITSDNVALHNFTIQGENHTNYAGIKVDSRNHTLIKNCTFMYNSYGIWLYSSRQNDITSCTFSSNYDGIWVHYFSQYNSVQWCHIFSNTHSGVYLCCASAHNTISQNTFTSNAAGVDAGFSWNEIYLNNFFNNTDNAQCPAHENTWDNGTVGNYWSDYDEPGEGAYDEDGDGIVDSPYVIPGEKENKDHYPLVMPINLTFNQPPTCTLSASSISGTAPLTVTFTLTASDLDGSIASWALDINNDGITDYGEPGSPPATEQHTYTAPGTYTANFTVTDNRGAATSATTVITVSQAPPQNQKPTCSLTANLTSGAAPLTITFTLAASDPDGYITAWVLDINSDGIPDYTGSGNPPATRQHTYTALGSYTANFTVTDNQSAKDSDTAVIMVGQPPPENQPPLADFTYSSNELFVTFTDTSTDPDGNITSWYWDFGDQNSSTTSSPTHDYTEEGDYVVNLTVTDDDNDTDSISYTITVEKKDDGGGIPGFQFICVILSIAGLVLLLQRKRGRDRD